MVLMPEELSAAAAHAATAVGLLQGITPQWQMPLVIAGSAQQQESHGDHAARSTSELPGVPADVDRVTLDNQPDGHALPQALAEALQLDDEMLQLALDLGLVQHKES